MKSVFILTYASISFILGSTDTIIRFDAISSVPSTSKKRDRWPTSFQTQFKMLTWRNFKQSKGRILHLYDVIKYIVVAAIIGTLYYQIQQNEDTVRDRVGLVTMPKQAHDVRATSYRCRCDSIDIETTLF